MNLWNMLGKSLGLLGKPYLIHNLQAKFGSSNQYWAIQLEWPKDYDSEKKEAEETVILLTPHEPEKGLARAKRNPEDLQKFLKDHVLQDTVD